MVGGRSSIPSEEEDMDGGASDSLGGCAAEFEMLAVSPFNMLISSCRPEII